MEVDGYSAKSECYGAFERRRETSTAGNRIQAEFKEVERGLEKIYLMMMNMKAYMHLERVLGSQREGDCGKRTQP